MNTNNILTITKPFGRWTTFNLNTMTRKDLTEMIGALDGLQSNKFILNQIDHAQETIVVTKEYGYDLLKKFKQMKDLTPYELKNMDFEIHFENGN